MPRSLVSDRRATESVGVPDEEQDALCFVLSVRLISPGSRRQGPTATSAAGVVVPVTDVT